MMNRQTTARDDGRGDVPGISAVVMVLHGGRSVSTRLTAPTQLSVLRMIPVARAVGRAVHAVPGAQRVPRVQAAPGAQRVPGVRALRTGGISVLRPRFRLRGWNGDQAAPVGDLAELLAQVAGRLGEVPVVLVGHSMGARAALRAAGHPLVIAVGALAPWLPPGEPAAQLAGRRVLLAHGSADRVTNPEDTWAYAQRARTAAPVTVIEVRDGDHAMARRARLWHAIAAEFTRAALGLPAADQALRDVLDQSGACGGGAQCGRAAL